MLTLLGALNSNLPGDEVSLLFFWSQNISHLRSFKNAPWCHQGFPDSLTTVAFSKIGQGPLGRLILRLILHLT